MFGIGLSLVTKTSELVPRRAMRMRIYRCGWRKGDGDRKSLNQLILRRFGSLDVTVVSPEFVSVLLISLMQIEIDVGGGSVPNDTPNTLARIPLRWMIRECFLANSGIMFESDKLCHLGLDPSTLWDQNGHVRVRPGPQPVGSAKIRSAPPTPKKPSVFYRFFHSILVILHLASSAEDKPHPEDEPVISIPNEEEEELRDALSPMYDQMEINPWWKILEYLPLTTRYQKENNEWVTRNRSELSHLMRAVIFLISVLCYLRSAGAIKEDHE
jgi:hypothetical protein